MSNDTSFVPEGADSAASKKEIRTVVASSIVGTTVEWYDFFLYGTAAGIIFNKLYFPSHDPTVGTLLSFATFALGFVARPVGGLIFGHIGDRVGRKRTLVATMLIMGVATCLIGVIPTYEQIGIWAPVLLIVMRLLQGVAIGGEWGGAVLMAIEYSPPGRRGLYGSLPQIGLAVGLMLGTGVFIGLGQLMSDDAFNSWGWRIAFLLSAILVFIGLYIRLKVMETPAFRKLESEQEKATVPAVDMFRERRSRRHVLLGLGTRWAEGVAFNTWAVFSISYGADTLGMPKNHFLIPVMVAAACMIVALPLFGRTSDRWGRRQQFSAGVIALGVLALPGFWMIHSGNQALIAIAIVVILGFVYPIIYAAQPAMYAELFPTNVRYTGISFVYQFSGIFASGLTPLILAWLIDKASGGYGTVVLYIAAVSVISVVCTLLIRRRDLAEDETTAGQTDTESQASGS